MNKIDNIPEKTTGLIAAPFSPFDAQGQLDVSIIPFYAEWLCREKVSGAFICGTTGEGPSLTTEERLQTTAAWVKSAPEQLRIIVHAGHNCLRDAQTIAAHAQSIGADAVAVMPPYFFRPRNIGEIAQWCCEVAQAAPNLPFYYYHIPSMSGVMVQVADLLPLLAQRIPAFAGVKFTYEDIEDYSSCLHYDDGKYDILFGRDEKLLSAIAAGATGAVGSTYNFAAPIYHQIIAAYREGNIEEAQRLQLLAIRMIDICLMGSWHPIAAFKTILQFAGVDCGPTRLPIPEMTGSQKNDLENQLREFYDASLLHRNNH